VKIYTLGGYNKVGKNMTAVEVDDDIVILDMGLDMEEVVQEEDELEQMSTKESFESGTIPDDGIIHEQRDKVKAIVIGHGHLDHIGALPKLAGAYDCPIIATPYTMKIANQRIDEDRKEVRNDQVVLRGGDRYWLSNSLEVEFIHVTHSIPHSVMTVLHTPEGTLLYSLDFRFDEEPVLGVPSDYERIRRLSREPVKALIGDSTRVEMQGGAETESMVREMIRHRLERLHDSKGALIFSTFSSHIERLNALLQVNKGRRKVAFLGRSLKDYAKLAEELDLIDLQDVHILSYYDEVSHFLKRTASVRDEWLLVCTGNQGEPGSVLRRLAEGEYPMQIREGDHILFSSTVIPTLLNQYNRQQLEQKLKRQGAVLHRDLHVSGHARREDTRRLIRMVNPMTIIPAHGTLQMEASYAALAQEEGYRLNETIFLSEDGNCLEL